MELVLFLLTAPNILINKLFCIF